MVLAWITGALLVLGTAAFAALTVTVTQDAVSGSDTIAECTATATISLGTSTYDPTDGRYEYADVTYSGVAACQNDTIHITAIDASNAVMATATGTIPAGGTATLSWSTEPPVADTTGVVVSIQNP
jgi:hypothetical protein